MMAGFNFGLGNTNNLNAATLEILTFAIVASLVLMPIVAIHFYRQLCVWNQKVNGIATYGELLQIRNSYFVQSQTDSFFNTTFAVEATITSKAAESPICFRFFAERLSARRADGIFGGAATLFGAIVPIKILFGTKSFPATFAGDIFGFGYAAGATTNGITLGNGSRDFKHLAANRAYFDNEIGGAVSIVAFKRAIVSTLVTLVAFESFATLLAESVAFDFGRCRVIARAAAIDLSLVSWREFLIAMPTICHKKRLLSRTVNALAEGAQPTIEGGHNYSFVRSNRQATATLSHSIIAQIQECY